MVQVRVQGRPPPRRPANDRQGGRPVPSYQMPFFRSGGAFMDHADRDLDNGIPGHGSRVPGGHDENNVSSCSFLLLRTRPLSTLCLHPLGNTAGPRRRWPSPPAARESDNGPGRHEHRPRKPAPWSVPHRCHHPWKSRLTHTLDEVAVLTPPPTPAEATEADPQLLLAWPLLLIYHVISKFQIFLLAGPSFSFFSPSSVSGQNAHAHAQHTQTPPTDRQRASPSSYQPPGDGQEDDAPWPLRYTTTPTPLPLNCQRSTHHTANPNFKTVGLLCLLA